MISPGTFGGIGGTFAVAAPTASLHFDAALLARIEAMGVQRTCVTLHVGAGTFQPVRVADPAQHVMHPERFEVPAEACDALNSARARGARIIAIGTTVVRTLEAAAPEPGAPWLPRRGDTRIFIPPGVRFRAVDALLTNFHLPESTLLYLLGLDHEKLTYRFQGRDFRLTDVHGKLVSKLLA